MKSVEGKTCVLGIDLGGTRTALSAVSRDGNIILSLESPSSRDDEEKMISTLIDIIGSGRDAAFRKGFKTIAIGMGIAGFILHDEGIVVESPNIDWSMVPLRRMVFESTGLPTFLDNDANAACLGEKLAGVASGSNNFIYLTLGTGIGGGIFADGKIYRGSRGTAAELGHMVIDKDGPLCGCGRRGCLEALASGTALVREASRLAHEFKDSKLLSLSGGKTEKITGELVAQAAQQGDPASLEAFSRISKYLGIGIANLIHIFDPEMVVLGGGMSRSGNLFLDKVKEAVCENGNSFLIRDARIRLSSLGREAGVIGAAAIAWEGIEDSL